MLPGDVLAGIRQDLGTIAEVVATYLDGGDGYRVLPFTVLGGELPADLTISTVWGHPEAPSPTPGTCFRWLARFAAGALAWWREAAAAIQMHGDYVPPTAPAPLARRARSEAKREALCWAWQAVHAFRLLAARLGAPISRWAFVMRHAPTPPRGLDRTTWFCKPPPPP